MAPSGGIELSDLRNQFQDFLKLCLERGVTFGFAESCTGGLLSAHAAMTPGISAAFKGSIVSYDSDIKIGTRKAFYFLTALQKEETHISNGIL